MTRLYYLLTLLCLVWTSTLAQGSAHLLRVEDTQHAPLVGAHIRYGSDTRVAVTDIQGQALLPVDLRHDVPLIITSIGYESLTTTLGTMTRRHGLYVATLLEERIQLGTGVVVTATRTPITNSAVARIDAVEIQRQAGRSLADLLEGVSGVSSIRTGTSAAKPVVHGMHGSRLLIINNGVRQAGQQWGEAHAPEVDMSSSHAIHIVKGAEGVRYGAEALGGTIIMEQKALPYGREHLSGNALSSYNTNGRRFVETFTLDGTIPTLPQLAWRAQALYGNSGDRSTAKYLLNNTGERELNFSAALGYDSGCLRLEGFASRYDTRHGSLRSAALGSVQVFQERIALGRPLEESLTPFSREISYPYEHVMHHTFTGKARYDFGRWGRLAYQGSLQTDSREEFRIRRTDSSVPELALSLTNFQSRLSWDIKHRAWEMELGAQHSLTDNHNVPGTGVVPVIPNYAEQTWGIYSIHKLNLKNLSLEGGIRLDGQETTASGYNISSQLYGGTRRFHNMSYSLGARYKAARALTLTTNLGIAWRAPHVHELYAAGADHGSAAFVIGDSTLRSEQSYKAVASLDYRTPWLHLTLDGYVQLIHDYIYDEPSLDNDGSPELISMISGTYPVFRYRQTNAFLRGLDLHLEIEPLPWLTYELTTALIYANEQHNNAYLPFIPPLRIDHAVSVSLGHIGSVTPHFRLGHRFVAKQTRFEPARDLVPDTPAAYHLFSAELAAGWQIDERNKLSLSLSGENLLNREYKEYTNRARYYSHDLGRDIRLALSWQF